MIPIVLASASPRRKALLAALGLSFDIIVSDADETNEGTPEDAVTANARAKRDDVAARLDAPALVIAADTLVVINGQRKTRKAGTDPSERVLRWGLGGAQTHLSSE